MNTSQRKWTCSNCGRRSTTVVKTEGTIQCEHCDAVFGVRPEMLAARLTDDDAHKREVVSRLRERYGEARDLIDSHPPPYAQPFGHLEWILGNHRDPDDDGAALGTAVSELVVLWLEDLALELDDRAYRPVLPGSGGGVASTARFRHAAAKDLRTATRDFADAFLSPGNGPSNAVERSP